MKHLDVELTMEKRIFYLHSKKLQHMRTQNSLFYVTLNSIMPLFGLARVKNYIRLFAEHFSIANNHGKDFDFSIRIFVWT